MNGRRVQLRIGLQSLRFREKRGTCNITLTAISENITGNVRTATLTLTSGTLTQDITIEQESAEFVNLEQNIYNVSVEGGELDIRFSTNIAEDELLIYGSLGTGTWLTQETKLCASSSYMLNLTVLPNTDGVSVLPISTL